jgi:small subunit ribosomal protein S17
MAHLKDIVIPENATRRTGVVTSDHREKSCKVEINYLVKHEKYGKYIRRRTVLQVHDADNQASVGDTIEVAECRPISKTKPWVLTQVVEKADKG